MTVYLKDIPYQTAWETWRQALKKQGLDGVLGTEDIPLDEQAVGRILAEPAWAKICSPHYHAAAMDGFAVKAESIQTALPSNPVELEVGLEAVYVDTGDPMPEEFNCVIPVENVESITQNGDPAVDIRKPDMLRIRASQAPWSYVRLMGEDMVASQLVLSAGHALRPVDLGALAACGHIRLRVAKKPMVHIIPTGTELIQVGAEIKPGDIIEFNSIVLAGQVNTWGASAKRQDIVIDRYDLIRAAVLQGAACADLILINAGSSAGSEDFSARVIEELGELLVHGVAVRPGHPVILGMVQNPAKPGMMVPIIGVPGYPVSAALTAEIFIKPLMAIWLGTQLNLSTQIQAKITQKINSPAGDDDYVRVIAARMGSDLLAAPLSRGAGVIHSLAKADGITVIPRGIQGLETGEEISVNLFCHPSVLEKTLFFSGSHDMTLDELSDELSQSGVRVVCTNVGSLGGLLALQRRQAHAAGSHLLDPETGEYNLKYIRQYLPETPVAVIHWVKREQGLIVKKGNPLRISALTDLSNPDIRFINRQRGAGTRVLLDYQLSLLGIPAKSITGYNQEEFTHLAVAAAVFSGRADCGLGITAAAQALGCDFIPLFHEDYELVVPQVYLDSELMERLLRTSKSSAFHKRIAGLPGYQANQTGQVRFIYP